MSKMYDKIKSYYDSGLWSEVRVRNMVVKEIITEEEYASIVGKKYKEYDAIYTTKHSTEAAKS